MLLLEHGFNEDTTFILVLSAICPLPFLYIVIENIFFKSITIDDKGVLYKTIFKNVFIKWDDVKSVGLAWLRSDIPVLYFTTDDGEWYEKNLRKITNDFIVFNYRKEIDVAVRLYWKDKIYDLDDRDYPRWAKNILK